jgi:hypothetical protein
MAPGWMNVTTGDFKSSEAADCWKEKRIQTENGRPKGRPFLSVIADAACFVAASPVAVWIVALSAGRIELDGPDRTRPSSDPLDQMAPK